MPADTHTRAKASSLKLAGLNRRQGGFRSETVVAYGCSTKGRCLICLLLLVLTFYVQQKCYYFFKAPNGDRHDEYGWYNVTVTLHRGPD